MEETEYGYDLLCDLMGAKLAEEHPLDRALRTNDAALRCYYWEHGNADDWHQLSQREKDSYDRPPVIPEHRLKSGIYYGYGAGHSIVPMTEQCAREHWAHSFRAQ